MCKEDNKQIGKKGDGSGDPKQNPFSGILEMGAQYLAYVAS